eukprot:CAMPEP_0119060586 /NCGR_PEP_ID=MMETSP1178-20130426/4529_1 /TAXON_ID=33656 /ORGANISM="unid sp, Strain CCMP2000" /LENGTH=161 /DNA_ID=CAMNT_0007041703 /DNA_START=69 /DNA_END=555 /DNA_ORIENTATION=-
MINVKTRTGACRHLELSEYEQARDNKGAEQQQQAREDRLLLLLARERASSLCGRRVGGEMTPKPNSDATNSKPDSAVEAAELKAECATAAVVLPCVAPSLAGAAAGALLAAAGRVGISSTTARERGSTCGRPRPYMGTMRSRAIAALQIGHCEPSCTSSHL